MLQVTYALPVPADYLPRYLSRYGSWVFTAPIHMLKCGGISKAANKQRRSSECAAGFFLSVSVGLGRQPAAPTLVRTRFNPIRSADPEKNDKIKI